MSNLFRTRLSPILNEICVSECRRKFSEKVACQRHMYKDWAPRKRPVEEHQLEFTCIAQKFTAGQILFVVFVDVARKTEDRSLAIIEPLNTPSEELAP